MPDFHLNISGPEMRHRSRVWWWKNYTAGPHERAFEVNKEWQDSCLGLPGQAKVLILVNNILQELFPSYNIISWLRTHNSHSSSNNSPQHSTQDWRQRNLRVLDFLYACAVGLKAHTCYTAVTPPQGSDIPRHRARERWRSIEMFSTLLWLLTIFSTCSLLVWPCTKPRVTAPKYGALYFISKCINLIGRFEKFVEKSAERK